jgi:hypothetical protein
MLTIELKREPHTALVSSRQTSKSFASGDDSLLSYNYTVSARKDNIDQTVCVLSHTVVMNPTCKSLQADESNDYKLHVICNRV